MFDLLQGLMTRKDDLVVQGINTKGFVAAVIVARHARSWASVRTLAVVAPLLVVGAGYSARRRDPLHRVARSDRMRGARSERASSPDPA